MRPGKETTMPEGWDDVFVATAAGLLILATMAGLAGLLNLFVR